MSAHTPGPWEACDGANVSINEIATIVPNHVRRTFYDDKGRRCHQFVADCNELPEAAANARLIAAAPDLLEALRAFVDRYVELVNCGDCGHWNPEEETEVITARAAIAKAEGREP